MVNAVKIAIDNFRRSIGKNKNLCVESLCELVCRALLLRTILCRFLLICLTVQYRNKIENYETCGDQYGKMAETNFEMKIRTV